MATTETGETFIFFDIESANNINGEGYICSFGYVICDENFNVLESNDIVMNPRVAFDEILLTEGSPCTLAYSREYFQSQPDFAYYYDTIKALLLAPHRTAFGFAVENDLGFLACACKHFNLEEVNFVAYDSQIVATKLQTSRGGLVNWMKHFGIDTSSFTIHKSSDDAMMTMLLVKKLCECREIGLGAFAENFPDAYHSVEQDKERRRFREYRRYMEQQCSSLVNQRNSNPHSRRLRGKFRLLFATNRDFDQMYEIIRLVYDNGGVVVKDIKPKCTVVGEDNKERPAWLDAPRFASVRYITFKQLFAMLGKEEPSFVEQSKNVPDLQDIFKEYLV